MLDARDIPDVEVLAWTHYSLQYAGNAPLCKGVIDKVLNYMKNNPSCHFDFIACVGNSGLGLGSILSYLIDKPFWHIRNSTVNRQTTEDDKVKDILHKEMSCNLQIPLHELRGKTYLFIDDLIASGKTFLMLKKTMDKLQAQCKYVCVNYGEVAITKLFPNNTNIVYI